MSWTVRWRGQEYSSLDLTLDEVEAVEKVADLPWSVVNPLARVAAAKAYLAVFLMRDGLNDDEIRAQLGALRLRDIAAAFEYVPDEPEIAPAAEEAEEESGALDPTNGARSSPRGSRGPRTGTTGRPTSPAAKPSATSLA